MSETKNGTIKLVSNDEKNFEVDFKTAIMSELLESILVSSSSSGTDDDEDEEDDLHVINRIPEVFLPNVNSAVLAKVLEFCKYHATYGPMKEIEKPLKSDNMVDLVDQWDAKFVSIERWSDDAKIAMSMLFELISAANFMNIKSLLDLCGAKVAIEIKGKTPEEIRDTFDIVNDFSQAVHTKIRLENEALREWTHSAIQLLSSNLVLSYH